MSLSDACECCAHDPTAPPALADPGLVLARGSDRPGFQDERKGWIMTVKLTDAQLVRFALVEDTALVRLCRPMDALEWRERPKERARRRTTRVVRLPDDGSERDCRAYSPQGHAGHAYDAQRGGPLAVNGADEALALQWPLADDALLSLPRARRRTEAQSCRFDPHRRVRPRLPRHQGHPASAASSIPRIQRQGSIPALVDRGGGKPACSPAVARESESDAVIRLAKEQDKWSRSNAWRTPGNDVSNLADELCRTVAMSGIAGVQA